MKKEYLTDDEINSLPNKYKLGKQGISALVVTLLLIALGAGLLAGGIVGLQKANEDGFILMIIFGGFSLFTSLGSAFFITIDKSKDQKTKKILIKQAINEVFSGKVIYDPISRVNNRLLIELDICPFEVAKSGEKIIVSKDNYNISINEVTSLSNLNDLLAFIIASPELGVVGSAVVWAAMTFDSIKEKRLMNRKFEGTIMVFPNMMNNSSEIVEVRSKKFITPLSSKFKANNKFETEDIRANDKYNFYATDPQKGFEYITPLMIETINSIDQKLKNGFILILKEDYIVLAFSEMSIDIADISQNRKITAKTAYFSIKKQLALYDDIINLMIQNKFKY